MPQGSLPGERRGGRQVGTPNKATTERLKLAQAAAMVLTTDRNTLSDTPVDTTDSWLSREFMGNALLFLQLTYRDVRFAHSVRLDAAKAAIRYESPALQAVTLSGDADNPVTLRTLDTRAPLDGRLASLLMQSGVKVVTHDVDDTGSVTATHVE